MNGKTSLVCQRLLAATLLLGGLNALAAPAFADGTAAGTSIDNTATATYDNPDDPTKPFNATSNTVKVTVAEVAGVTVTPLSTIDVNGGVVAPNDLVNYEFKVKNVGNDTTEFFIPGTPNVVGPASATAVQITGYIQPDGTRVNFPAIVVPAGGTKTGALTTLPVFPNPAGGNFPAGVIPAGYSLVVNVPTTISNLAASGAPVTVRLGNTGANDNSASTQNQTDGTDGANADEVRTVDYTGETGATLGPVSEEKEASSIQTVQVGSQSQALATILKTRTSYVPNSTTILSDDVIGYGLTLKVESAAPAGSTGITPGKLVGTDIKVGGTTVNRVLLSDAVPASTKLTAAGDVVKPNGNWTVVYTTDLLSTPAANAAWVTGFSNTATRIGFIYDAGTNGAIAEGTTLTGFGFKVVTSGVTATTPTNIFNIAQVFGQTQGNVGPTAPLVYDESGDQAPSNFNDNGTPGNTATLTPTSPNIPSGNPDATNDGVDNTNDNTGQGPGGEDNVTTIALSGAILNGPSGNPGAVGPTDNNSDFTNRSTPVPANTPPLVPGGIDPAEVTFTNSIQNPSTTLPLANVLLVPDTAAFVASAGDQLPPNGTKVSIVYGGQTAVYTFDSTAGVNNFVFTSGTAITIPTLAANQIVNYDVKVDLPAGTTLSTDTGKGFSIPIYAFVDEGTKNSRPDAAELTQNRTIDRVYTGFLKLTKEAQILDKDGATVLQAFTTDSTLLANKGSVGRFIEYRISYKNISIAPAGNGNATLDAKNIAITEDGVSGGNTWAKDNDANGLIDTSHKMGSVSVTYGGPASVIYSPSGEQTGTTAATDVTKYVHKPGVIIQPQDQGTFIFRRRIN